MHNLYLIHLSARRDRSPSTFAVECDVDSACERVTLIRVADGEHVLNESEVQELMEKRGLERAILKAEWRRRTPAALRDDRDDDDVVTRSRD